MHETIGDGPATPDLEAVDDGSVAPPQACDLFLVVARAMWCGQSIAEAQWTFSHRQRTRLSQTHVTRDTSSGISSKGCAVSGIRHGCACACYCKFLIFCADQFDDPPPLIFRRSRYLCLFPLDLVIICSPTDRSRTCHHRLLSCSISEFFAAQNKLVYRIKSENKLHVRVITNPMYHFSSCILSFICMLAHPLAPL
jgi:hypothetical protein